VINTESLGIRVLAGDIFFLRFRDMLVIGLTGGIGSGKTEVSNRFARLGVPIIDNDHLARELVEQGQPALKEIGIAFGHSCLDEHGQLRRKYLRKQVFEDPDSRHKLEAILHPRILELIQERIARIVSTFSKYCLVVIPLLVETGTFGFVDRVLVVDTSENDQIRRVMLRDGITEEEAKLIISVQASRIERLALADDILENIGNINLIDQQILNLHNFYIALSQDCAD
jgi:dephospho-CoA kinase